MKSRHECVSRFSRIPWRPFLRPMNLGTGNNASSKNACEEIDERSVESMLASVMSKGWATRSPVIKLSLVLSDDRVTPRRVACGGSQLWNISNENGWY